MMPFYRNSTPYLYFTFNSNMANKSVLDLYVSTMYGNIKISKFENRFVFSDNGKKLKVKLTEEETLILSKGMDKKPYQYVIVYVQFRYNIDDVLTYSDIKNLPQSLNQILEVITDEN